jgi:hypothetical protein
MRLPIGHSAVGHLDLNERFAIFWPVCGTALAALVDDLDTRFRFVCVDKLAEEALLLRIVDDFFPLTLVCIDQG